MMEFNSKVKIILDRITNPNYPDRNLPDPYNRKPAAPEAPAHDTGKPNMRTPAAAGTWQPASDPAIEQAVQQLIAHYNELKTYGEEHPEEAIDVRTELLKFWSKSHQTKQEWVRGALEVNHKHTVAREILDIIPEDPSAMA